MSLFNETDKWRNDKWRALYIYIKCRWKRLHFILLQRTPASNLHSCTSLQCNLQLDEWIASKRIHACMCSFSSFAYHTCVCAFFKSCTNACKHRFFCMHIHRAMMMVMTMMIITINVFIVVSVVVVVVLWRLRDTTSTNRLINRDDFKSLTSLKNLKLNKIIL